MRFVIALLIGMLAGCASAPMLVTATLGTVAWMAPEAKRTDLLYASSIRGRVMVFDYPNGGLVGTFEVATGIGVWGICSDRNGDVFITSQQSATSSFVYEYAHGGTTPIATLHDDGYAANDCSSDPVTGNLAVANYDFGPSGGANVAIYTGARGKPHHYGDSKLSVAYCGYDQNGNLFVDGRGTYQLAELPRGDNKLENIGLNQHLVVPGGVEWDGTHLAVEDGGYMRRFAAIDRVALAKSKAVVVGVTHLRGQPNRGATFWLQGRDVVSVAGQQDTRVGLWLYPKGGFYTRLFHGQGVRGDGLYGVTVSKAPSH